MAELDRIVVVIPARNEIAHLRTCLHALSSATSCITTPVLTVLVLDSSDDGSDRLAAQFGPDLHVVSVEEGNVGAARAAGFDYARTLCDDADPARIWYGTSDADSAVPAGWLLKMTAIDADMVLGVVRVPVWRHFCADDAHRYLQMYGSKGKEHNHVHGANMGFRADAYWSVGGFRALQSGEDVDLVERFEASGLRVHRDSTLSVETSDRRDARAPGGFAAHLRRLARSGIPTEFSEPA